MANDYIYTSKRLVDEVAKYTLGRVEQLIEDSARSSKISAHLLTHRVAELLLAQAGGPILGVEDSVPALRGNGTGHDQSLESVALARGPRYGTQSMEGRHQAQARPIGRPRKDATIEQAALGLNIHGNRSGRPGFKYNGTHWTQTPRGRAHMRKLAAKANQRFKRTANGSPPFVKGYKYNGTHWMQNPKNRARVLALNRKGRAAHQRNARERRALATARKYVK